MCVRNLLSYEREWHKPTLAHSGWTCLSHGPIAEQMPIMLPDRPPARPDVCECVLGWHGTLKYRGRPLQSLCGVMRDKVMCVWAPSAGVPLSLISLLREYWGHIVPLPVNSVLMLSALHQGDGCAHFRGLAEAHLCCRSVLLVHSRILWKRGGWRLCVQCHHLLSW